MVLGVEAASQGHRAQLKYFRSAWGSIIHRGSAEHSHDLARVLLNRFDFPHKGSADERHAEGTKNAESVPAGVKDDSVD